MTCSTITLMLFALIAALCCLHTVDSTSLLGRSCVLGRDGQMECKSTPRTLSSAVRAKSSPPCSKSDLTCWNKKALDYTNDVRRKKGRLSMLKLGTEKQLDNAMQYARKLAGMGFLRHQKLGDATRQVGCKRWMGGENLAFNYKGGDVARTCVDQWIDSDLHYDNLIRDWFKEMVVGFYFKPDGSVWCVQTFAMEYPTKTFGSTSDAGCDSINRGASSPNNANPSSPSSASADNNNSANDQPPRNESSGESTDESPDESPAQPRHEADASEGGMSNSPKSCECIKRGRFCTRSLAAQAGHQCKSGSRRFKQTTSCKADCCSFCSNNRNSGLCANRDVRRICRIG